MKKALKWVVVTILTWEARAVLRKYKPRIVAVTGNVGKTSTKDAIHAVLDTSLYVRKSAKSLNTEFGVPLTILGCESGWGNPLKWLQNMLRGLSLIALPNHYPRWLVLEVGADHPGDIKTLAQWLPCDVVVLTALPDVPVHVEFFDSPEDVCAEKLSLLRALVPGGVVIANGDDARIRAALGERGIDARYYGLERRNTVAVTHVSPVTEAGYIRGLRSHIEVGGGSIPVTLPGRLGVAHVYAALAAVAVADALGMSTLKAIDALAASEPPKGRMRILRGVEGSMIIDDSYNSSPAAAKAALETLTELPVTGRRIAVLADMLELGRYSVEQHKSIGESVSQVADILVTVGVRAKGIAQAARAAGMNEENIFEFESDGAVEAGKRVRELLTEGDVVLVKGSQSLRLERTVKELMQERQRAEELLVRQERAWLAR